MTDDQRAIAPGADPKLSSKNRVSIEKIDVNLCSTQIDDDAVSLDPLPRPIDADGICNISRANALCRRTVALPLRVTHLYSPEPAPRPPGFLHLQPRPAAFPGQ